MKILLLGGAGFIGTNLAIRLAADPENRITVADRHPAYFRHLAKMGFPNVRPMLSDLSFDEDYDALLAGQDVVYHLISTSMPTNSNRHIPEELKANVLLSANLFEACVRQKAGKVVFISSGGTVYGTESDCPLSEDMPTNPITSYGVQKITIEKLLYLYSYMYGLDYRIIRLANPYGPYQRPTGELGAVTTFTYKALRGEEIEVYGDGSVVRDFIYIDDAIRGILNIVNGNASERVYNLGSGQGTSILQVLETIERALDVKLNVKYTEARTVDVPVNYLNISRYEEAFGFLHPIPLEEGICKTAEFMKTIEWNKGDGLFRSR